MDYNIGIIVFIVIIIIIILIVCIYYLGMSFPGLFINWNDTCHWHKERLGKSLFSSTEVNKLEHLVKDDTHIEWKNSTLGKIGKAAYLDFPYEHTVIESNKYIYNRYGIHDKLAPYLTQRLGEKCVFPYIEYNHPIALPGFHVFSKDSILGKGYHVASVHTDQQEHKVKWPIHETFDYTRTLSFTIPITCPRNTGLYIMDKHPECVKPGIPLWWTLRNANIQLINYKLGHCYIHHGKWFHMISPFNGKDGDRITVQGHAIYCTSRNEYWLYW